MQLFHSFSIKHLIFISHFFTQVWFDWVHLNYLRVEAWTELTSPWETFDISLAVNIVLLTANVTWDICNREQKTRLRVLVISHEIKWLISDRNLKSTEFIQVSHRSTSE